MQMAPSGNVFLHATRKKSLIICIICNPILHDEKKKKKNCNYCCGFCIGRSRKLPSHSAATTPHPACSAALTRRKTTSAGVPRKGGLTLQDRIVRLKWVMSGGEFVLPFTVRLTNGHAPSRQDVFVQEDVWVLRRIHLLISVVSPSHALCRSLVWLWCPLFGSGLYQEGTHSISERRKEKRFPRV